MRKMGRTEWMVRTISERSVWVGLPIVLVPRVFYNREH